MRRFLTGGLACILLAAAASCAPTGGTVSPDAVTIFAPYRGTEAQRFMASLDRWAHQQGIEVVYTGTGNLPSDLRSRIANGDPPDIALVPQPGLVEALHEEGDLPPLSSEVTDIAAETMGPDAMGLGEVDGTQVGFPFRINTKSLIWYRPSQFEELGLEAPDTLDELTALVDAIRDQDLTPWCLGIEAQDATGWPATDWVEDLVVRQWGGEVYEDWIDGVVPFADPRIAESFATFHDLVLARGMVFGGPSAVLRTPVSSAGAPLFTDEPGCLLYHAPSFAFGWMPEGTTIGAEGDIDVFDVPSVDGGAPPVVVGTDLVVSFDPRAEVQEVMAFLATPDAGRSWAEAGDFLSPSDGIAPDEYAQSTRRLLAQTVTDETMLVVDASDAMPPVIGTDLFWSEISRWVVGSVTYDEMAATLDAAYPRVPDAG